MDDQRFDDLTRTLARVLSRRSALKVAAAGLLAAIGQRAGADAQVTQVYCGNQFCASSPGGCKPGCVCCIYTNSVGQVTNSRCRPPGLCAPGTEAGGSVPTTTPAPTTTTVRPTTTATPTTAAPTTTTPAPTTTTSTAQPTTTATPTTTPAPTTTSAPTSTTTLPPTTTTTTTTAPVDPCAAGGTCTDGLDCTNSHCDPQRGCVHDLRSGFCLVGGVCYAHGQAHASGCATCDVNVSTSSLTPVANGTTCNDGNPCTQTDTCQNGACVGGNPIICLVINDPCNSWACNPANGQCASTPKPLGTSCSNFSPCDGGEICNGQGSCVAGAPIDCGPCNACDRTTGICRPANNDATCPGDGNRCFEAFACANGTCVGTQPVVCGADQCHDPGTCIPATGQCSDPTSKANGIACTSNNLCVQGATCQNGACTGGSSVVCPEHSEICHDFVCDSTTGMCVDTALSGGSFDRKGCDVCVACIGGECAPGVDLLDCGPCATCDRTLQTCVLKSVGSDCGSTCTERAACQANGSCLLTPNTIGCVNVDFCQDFVCNSATGSCMETGAKNGQACNGDLCHVCAGGQCVEKTCGRCQRCDPATGGCVGCASCCEGACCGPDEACCSSGGDSVCRPKDQVCEGKCFGTARTCCGLKPNGTTSTCDIGSSCCRDIAGDFDCCAPDQQCCFTGCCPPNYVCGAGGCAPR